MSAKELVAINQIVHKPKQKIEAVMPGERFTPKDEDRERFLKSGAARELTDDEAGSAKKSSTKKASAQKDSAGKATPSAQKPVVMENEGGGDEANTADDDMLG